MGAKKRELSAVERAEQEGRRSFAEPASQASEDSAGPRRKQAGKKKSKFALEYVVDEVCRSTVATCPSRV